MYHIIAYPLYSLDGVVSAVVEVQRKRGRESFSEATFKLLHAFARETQISLLLKEKIMRIEKREARLSFINSILRVIFSQIHHLETVTKTIMAYAKILLSAGRATLFLLDKASHELVSSVIDVGDLKTTKFATVEQIRISLENGIAGFVARTGTPVITNNPEKDAHFFSGVDKMSGFKTVNMISVPIKVNEEVQGVLQLLNKSRGEFNEIDLESLTDFAVFCGLALHISRMYEKMYRAEQKSRVTMEILLHHNIASDEDVLNYSKHKIPDAIEGIADPLFSPWHIPDDEKPAAVIFMIRDLVGAQNIDVNSLVRFVLTVRKNYRPVTYHNWFHGFSVTHGTYVSLKGIHTRFTTLEKFCLLVASLCHDLDHRGRDNSFLRKSKSALAALYSSSPLEHHHFNMTVTILQQPGNQIFASFGHESYFETLMIIKHAILSTDLGRFEKSKGNFDDALAKPGGVDWNNKDDRMAVIAILLPSSDLCSMHKTWKVHVKVVLIVMEEMWSQGDEEKEQGMKPIANMDRDLSYNLPNIQAGFLKAICLPCFQRVSQVVSIQKRALDQALNNLEVWESLAALTLEKKKAAVEEIIRLMPSATQESRTRNSSILKPAS